MAARGGSSRGAEQGASRRGALFRQAGTSCASGGGPGRRSPPHGADRRDRRAFSVCATTLPPDLTRDPRRRLLPRRLRVRASRSAPPDPAHTTAWADAAAVVAAHREQHRLTEQPANAGVRVPGPFPTPDAGAAYVDACWAAATATVTARHHAQPRPEAQPQRRPAAPPSSPRSAPQPEPVHQQEGPRRDGTPQPGREWQDTDGQQPRLRW